MTYHAPYVRLPEFRCGMVRRTSDLRLVCVLTNGTPISRSEFLDATRNGPVVVVGSVD